MSDRTAAYCSSTDVKVRLAGLPINMSGAFLGALVAKIPEVCRDIDRMVGTARGQWPGWSFLAAQAHEIQQVSFAEATTAGTFKLALGAIETADIAFDADSVAVAAALNTALGAGTVTVAPAGAGGPFAVTFAAAGPQDLLVAISSLTPTTSYLVVERLVPGAVIPETRRYTAPLTSRILPIDDAVEVLAVRLVARGGSSRALVAGTDYITAPYNRTPITALQLIRPGVWPTNPAGVEVDLVPGYASEVLADVRETAIIEVIRSYFGDRTGNNDKVGQPPLGGRIEISKSFTPKLNQLVRDYARGDAFLGTFGS